MDKKKSKYMQKERYKERLLLVDKKKDFFLMSFYYVFRYDRNLTNFRIIFKTSIVFLFLKYEYMKYGDLFNLNVKFCVHVSFELYVFKKV